MSASLTSGLPSRDTCTHGPLDVSAPPGLRTRAFCRLAEAQTPITEVADIGSVGVDPSTVRSLIGTWMARVCTL